MAYEIDYTPSKVCGQFMASNAKMRTLMGPVGSGKSVTSTFELIRRAGEQEPNKLGIRKTRCAVVRETARQLQDTTIKTFLDWFPEGICGRYMRTTKTYFFKVADIECEVMFRALDDADDVANLNSLELTFAWFNECRGLRHRPGSVLENLVRASKGEPVPDRAGLNCPKQGKDCDICRDGNCHC
jgi:hypothetical protein